MVDWSGGLVARIPELRERVSALEKALAIPAGWSRAHAIELAAEDVRRVAGALGLLDPEVSEP